MADIGDQERPFRKFLNHPSTCIRRVRHIGLRVTPQAPSSKGNHSLPPLPFSGRPPSAPPLVDPLLPFISPTWTILLAAEIARAAGQRRLLREAQARMNSHRSYEKPATHVLCLKSDVPRRSRLVPGAQNEESLVNTSSRSGLGASVIPPNRRVSQAATAKVLMLPRLRRIIPMRIVPGSKTCCSRIWAGVEEEVPAMRILTRHKPTQTHPCCGP